MVEEEDRCTGGMDTCKKDRCSQHSPERGLDKYVPVLLQLFQARLAGPESWSLSNCCSPLKGAEVEDQPTW